METLEVYKGWRINPKHFYIVNANGDEFKGHLIGYKRTFFRKKLQIVMYDVEEYRNGIERIHHYIKKINDKDITCFLGEDESDRIHLPVPSSDKHEMLSFP